MRVTNTTARLAIGLPVLAACFLLIGASSPPAPAVFGHACAAWAEDSVATKKDRVEFIVKYAEPIGETLTAVFPKGAQVDVISATRAPAGEPQTAKLVLNTIRAVPGKWQLTLTGASGECAGDVYVGMKKPGDK